MGIQLEDEETVKWLIDAFFCKGKVAQERVNVDFRWGENLVVIEDVPAGVCCQCGEKYFDAEVYKDMEKLVKGRATPFKRLTIDVIKFERPVPV